MHLRNIALAAMVLMSIPGTASATVPHSVTIQGRLTDSLGVPLPAGLKGFTFRIFNAPSGGTEIWSGEDQFLNTGSDGLWIANVGAIVGLTDAVFADTVRWLQVSVDNVHLPRVRLVTGPFAHRVSTVDGATGGTISGKVAIGSGHFNVGFESFVAGFDNNVDGDYTSVTGGQSNAANGQFSHVGGGQNDTANGDHSAIVGGLTNHTQGLWSFVGGGFGNRSTSEGAATVGGGSNRASGTYSFIGGGGGSPADSNSAPGAWSSVVGGVQNRASGLASFVGGGVGNIAKSGTATIAGGSNNRADTGNNFIGGGRDNHTDQADCIVGGGWMNEALGNTASILGGRGNVASGIGSTVVGGNYNRARGNFSFVGGGGDQLSDSNLALGFQSVVVGGQQNVALVQQSFIGGGEGNRALGLYSVIPGGFHNSATQLYGVVGGGLYNSASGGAATVPGGANDTASGLFSLAAGFRANAAHDGSFVWADSTNAQFASTAADQFLIRANGGVGIGTNSPEAPLHIVETSAGAVTALAASIAVFERSGTNLISLLTPEFDTRGIVFGDPGNASDGGIFYASELENGLSFRANGGVTRMVIDSLGNTGVGTTAPEAQLHVLESSSGAVTANAASVGVFERNNDAYISILSPAADERGVLFGEPGAPEAGGIIYNNVATTDGFHFRVAGNSTRMVLTSGGRVGLGVANTAPSNVLTLPNLASVEGRGLANAWSVYSSRRWKKNITPIGDALAKVQRLNGVEYDWKADSKHDIGVIAEDVGAVIPEVVDYEENGIDAKSVDYSRLTALLIEAVKEQQRQIEELRATIKSMAQ